MDQADLKNKFISWLTFRIMKLQEDSNLPVFPSASPSSFLRTDSGSHFAFSVWHKEKRHMVIIDTWYFQGLTTFLFISMRSISWIYLSLWYLIIVSDIIVVTVVPYHCKRRNISYRHTMLGWDRIRTIHYPDKTVQHSRAAEWVCMAEHCMKPEHFGEAFSCCWAHV